MRWTVLALKDDGSAEVLAENVEDDRADAIVRHPSLSDVRTMVVASWDVPVGAVR